MTQSFHFTDADGDVVGAEFIDDPDQGPVLWLRTQPDGCYIPAARLAEFITGLKNIADSNSATTA